MFELWYFCLLLWTCSAVEAKRRHRHLFNCSRRWAVPWFHGDYSLLRRPRVTHRSFSPHESLLNFQYTVYVLNRQPKQCHKHIRCCLWRKVSYCLTSIATLHLVVHSPVSACKMNGRTNKATGQYAMVAGGFSNQCVGTASAISGGQGNTVTGMQTAFVLVGDVVNWVWLQFVFDWTILVLCRTLRSCERW